MRIRISADSERAERFLNRAPAAQMNALLRTVKDVIDALFAASQDEVKVDKGTLKKSGSWIVEGLRGLVTYAASHAPHVYFGTRPHPIDPVKGKFLSFPPSGSRPVFRGGQRKGLFEFGGRSVVVPLVFARHVEHPGTKPDPWLDRARDRIEPLVPQFLERNLQEEFAKAGSP